MPEQRVIPMFSYEDVGRAADWIATAFGFTETGRWSDDEGRVTHLNMELDGGMIMLGSPSRDYQSPKHHAEVCEQARRSCRSSRTTRESDSGNTGPKI
jgi:uncharacterized glyoxalase superfamily protein PhnB